MKDEKDNNEIHDALPVEPTDSNNNPYIPPRRALWADLLTIVGVYIGANIILGTILAVFANIIGGDIMISTIIAQVLVYAVTIPIAIWLLRKRGMKKPILSFSFRSTDPLTIIWGFLLIFIMGVVIEPLIDIFPAEYLNEVNKIITESGGIGMLMVVVMAPVLEEILFRGLIQNSASREYGPVRGILIASAIFGIIHLVPQQVINAFFCGIILGYIYYRTKSLIPVIAIHLLNNGVAYISARMSPDTAGETMRQLIKNDTWYWIIYTACAAIFIYAMFKLWQQINRAERKLINRDQ